MLTTLNFLNFDLSQLESFTVHHWSLIKSHIFTIIQSNIFFFTDYYKYDVDTSDLVLNDASFHKLIKRDLPKDTKPSQNATTISVPATDNTTYQPTSASKPINATVFTPHNLGVNGTGQRKDIKTDIKSDVKLDVKPDKLNVTLNKNVSLGVTVKPVTINATTVAPMKLNVTNVTKDDEIAISHHLDDIYNKTVEIYNNKTSEKDKMLHTEEVRNIFYYNV